VPQNKISTARVLFEIQNQSNESGVQVDKYVKGGSPMNIDIDGLMEQAQAELNEVKNRQEYLADQIAHIKAVKKYSESRDSVTATPPVSGADSTEPEGLENDKAADDSTSEDKEVEGEAPSDPELGSVRERWWSTDGTKDRKKGWFVTG
jgi:hypothetical protein